jgi:hypothetical protein
VFPVHPLSIRLVPGPPRSAHFVYGGDQYEQALWPSAWLCWRSNAALDGEAMIQDQHMCYPASISFLSREGQMGLRRRDFIAGLGAAAWPLAARAQQPAMPVIGYLNVGGAAHPDELSAFHKGLGEFGYVEAAT